MEQKNISNLLSITFIIILFILILGLEKCEPPPNEGNPLIGCNKGEFSVYYGTLHSHTSYSDGEGTPEEAYAYARDIGKLDIFALTDHLEQLYLPPPTDKWEKTLKAADDANEDGVFVALAGYEYGSAFDLEGEPPFIYSSGHNNVFFIDYLMPIVQVDYEEFYKYVIDCPSCIVQFNHPGEEYQSNWDNFAYNSAVDVKMKTFELSGAGNTWPIYFTALDKGWHISPVWNEDNHNPDWGTQGEARTGFWLLSLTREGVKDALQNLRTFSTTDKNASIEMFTEEGCFMGSDISGKLFTTLTIIAIDNDINDGFSNIEIYTNSQRLLGTYNCNNQNVCIWKIEVNLKSSGYILARALQTDGGILVSSPIWFY